MAQKIMPRDVLQQAHDWIKASFWITGDEVRYDRPDYKGVFHGGDKFIEVPWGNPGTSKPTRALGICSVGGLALARAVLGKEQVQPFSTYMGEDRSTAIAALALFTAIQDKVDIALCDPRDPSDAIIDWNDSGVEKKEILRRFRQALKSPLLSARQIWTLCINGRLVPRYYASRADAEAALKHFLVNPRARQWSPVYDALNDQLDGTTAWSGEVVKHPLPA